ncbi:hypothetical protein ACJIZ3_001725 [Penstemon smallii]|uniref:Uncharacterized protein n=1 Tax=Penstemon smallii TaxID=265156 RepID=A0ABD3U4H9_9LAMI
MDKNKNRTDLLAAGRKKLQQFRQKKDNKGNNSKSSSKAVKSGRDAGVDSAIESAETQQNVADGKESTLDVEDTITSSESSSRVDTVAIDTGVSTDTLSEKADSFETASSAVAVEFPSEGSEKEDGIQPKGGTSSVVPEDENHNVPGISDPIVLRDKSADSSIPLPIDSSSQLERHHGEEQVTDVGAMQEVGSSSSNQNDKGGVKLVEGHGSLSNEFSGTAGDHVISDVGNTEAEEGTHVASQLRKPDDTLSSDIAINDSVEVQKTMPTVGSDMTDQLREDISSGLPNEEKTGFINDSVGYDGVTQIEGHGTLSNVFSGTVGDHVMSDSGNTEAEEPTRVASKLTHDAEEAHDKHNLSSVISSTQSETVPALSSEMTYQQREDISSGLLNEEKTGILDVSVGSDCGPSEGTKASSAVTDEAKSLEIDYSTKSLGCKEVDLSSGLNGSLIKLSQLAEILQILDEDEVRFLFMSIESYSVKSKDTDKMEVSDYVVHDAFDRLKEHLYVTSFSKDTFHLQLSEHQKLFDEISAANASLSNFQGENEVLTEQIAVCRNELQEAISEKEEIDKQLHSSKTEVEVLSAHISDLENKFEMTQGDMSILSSELVECRNFVEALQAENISLNGSVAMMSEVKKKLLEENGIILLENDNIKGELAQCKASLESLQKKEVELTENLTLIRDERSRFEEEKNYIVHENSKLLADLAECKSEIEALKVENKNLNDIFRSVSEDKKTLEDEKELVIHHTEKLSEELMSSKDLVVSFQTEISNLNECLKSLTEERNKFEEEKKNISIEYEKQSNEVTEIKVSEAGWKEECSKSVDALKEATLRMNQLAEENEILKTNLEFHNSNMKDFEDVANRSVESEVLTFEKHKSDSSSLDQLKLDVYDDSSGFVALKRHLEDAAILVEKLEKAIEGMRLSRSNDKVAASGVSRLILAFESKGHSDEHDAEEPPSGIQTTEDPYMMAKLVTDHMGAFLKNIVLDAENASEFCKGVIQSKQLADAAGTGLRSNYDALREYTDLVEEKNIELIVLYEAFRENVSHAAAKEAEFHTSFDALHKQELILKSENIQLREKLNDFHVKISEVQSQLDQIYKDSEEMVASISNQVITLQTEVAGRESVLEEEWNSVVAQVLQKVGELDATIKTLNSNSSDVDSTIDVISHVAASVDGATRVIEDLLRQLEAAQKDHRAVSDAYDDMHEKSSNLQVKNEMTLNTLHRLYKDLSELVSETLGYGSDETENVLVDEKIMDILHEDVFSTILDQLKKFLGERLQLESANKQLNSELMNKGRDIDELENKCLKSDTIIKLVEDIEQSLRKDGIGIEIDTHEPDSRLEFLIHLLFQKYKEAVQGISLSTSLEMQLSDLRGQVEHLKFAVVQYENENLVYKHSLKSAEENLISINSRVQEKVTELEQSEQRVASLREKLSIAVTKGKGLISQRESLKQSLAETSKELEKCSQELLSKDARLHELETKLKLYGEAGERMEALESELSYIRNSATALRESFLLKDSVLQRIEEILEDLELPEHFHSRDIIEKIDWLAKSVTGNSLPVNDWDQRSSVGGGSYSDAGVVGSDGSKEEMMPTSNSGEDLRRRFEELQNKFYGLAEQNEMLEQSLMERNNLVQRWEEILDRVDMPSQLRSLDPEDKIQWFESALSEAQNQCSSLQQKIENSESFCKSLTADVEYSQKRIAELEEAFQQVFRENENLSKDIEIMSHDNDENIKRTADFQVRNEKLQNEVTMLQELRFRIEEDIHNTEGAIRRLQELVMDALQSSNTEDMVFGQEGVNYLEEMLRNLVERYKALSTEKPVNVDPIDAHINEKGELSHISRDCEELEVDTLSKKLDDCMSELMCVKEERDGYMLNNQSLLRETEALEIKRNELQELLNQEEHKSASLREKLNVAVRKGKSLVQQRDGMKQVIEELNAEVERLKSEIKHTEKTLSDYEEWIKDLSASRERVQDLESENMLLRDRMAETASCLQEKEASWSCMLDALDVIDVGPAFNSRNPIEKLKKIGDQLNDLRTSLDSAEQESRKSKKAAELLLAELNEVQERNDGLQEELAKATHELSEVSREREIAETAKSEALAHVEKLSYFHAEEKEKHLSEIMMLKSGVNQMREDLFTTERELNDVLSKDLEVLHNVEAMMKSFLELRGTPDLIAPFPGGFRDVIMSKNSEDKVFITEIGSLRERLYNHSHLLHEETCHLSEVIRNVNREFVSQKESYESIKRDVKRLESIEKEKESELHILRENISLLYETCTSAGLELENWKNHVVGNVLASDNPERNSQISVKEGNSLTNDMHNFTEEGSRVMCKKLLLVVKDLVSKQKEFMDVGQRDMKNTLLNLQKELQEKDIQRDRICMELVNQIKEAETNAKNYLHDLQQVRATVHDLQRQLDLMKAEREVLDKRMKELQDQETNSIDLHQKVISLTNALTAKEQETEALIQALDEEEAQMEDLTNKIGRLENELKEKNKDLENLEASHAKALKKLSITVSKFDELHYFSESLLSEVEKLQAQLQERDGEISFLRQEVTRCTNDALSVTQMSKKTSSDEIYDLLAWLESLISRVKVNDETSDNTKNRQVNEYKETLQKQIMALISELENLRLMSQNDDMLLQQERSKVEELAQKEQFLRNSLREKDSQILMLQGAGDSAKDIKSSSEIVEVEQMKNSWASSGTIAPQVRSLRKTNNDQVAIAIETDHSSEALEEEDDDKAHGFRSLTTSKIVPRFTRPISDMVDGLWVSCDRALMRQPALRLGVIIYWAVLHALLATFVV